MTINQIIGLLVGDVVSYDEGGWACKFDKEAKETIINALEKQIPKKPEKWESRKLHCPICDEELAVFTKGNYCPNCGQRLE